MKETSKNMNLTLCKAQEGGCKQGGDAVEDKVGEENENVSPSGSVVDVQRLVVLVADSILAVLTVAGSIFVDEVTTNSADELSCPILAGLPGGRIEMCKLIVSAYNLEAAVMNVRIMTKARVRL